MTGSFKAAALAAFVAAVTSLAAQPAPAQQENAASSGSAGPVDPEMLRLGGVLYSANCSQCHQVAGSGTPPTFPALAGNERLDDLALIAGNIHNGKGAMPAFPRLDSEKIAALATYIRNTWGNSFGGVTAEDVDAALKAGIGAAAGGGASAGPTMSVWDGVYTEAQDMRGQAVHSAACSRCHGSRLNGAAAPDMPPSPAIAGAGFLRKWQGRTVDTLFQYVRTAMPADNPGTLTDQQYADAIAHMFAVTGMPAGDKELPTDPKELARIAIEPRP